MRTVKDAAYMKIFREFGPLLTNKELMDKARAHSTFKDMSEKALEKDVDRFVGHYHTLGYLERTEGKLKLWLPPSGEIGYHVVRKEGGRRFSKMKEKEATSAISGLRSHGKRGATVVEVALETGGRLDPTSDIREILSAAKKQRFRIYSTEKELWEE